MSDPGDRSSEEGIGNLERLREGLLDTIDQVEEAGNFATGGAIEEHPNPCISVREGKVMSLPLRAEDARALEALSDVSDDAVSVIDAKNITIQQLSEDVFSDQIDLQIQATNRIRKVLCKERNPPIEEVIKTGVVSRFVKLLRSPHTPLQLEAAWALTNIASGSAAQTQVVIEAGAVPIFVELLASPEPDVRELAVSALGNIAGDSPQCREYVLSCGALKPLLALLGDSRKLSMLRNATWTLSNFCRGRTPQPDWNTIAPALPVLSKLLYSLDDEVLINACWAISYLSDGSNDKIQAVIEAGIPHRLVELLMHASTSVQTPALRSVGNIVTGDEVQTQTIINCGALPCLLSVLSSNKNSIRKETCWTISNITAGNSTQIQAVVDANIIPPLIHLLSNGDLKTRKEACYAITNTISRGLLKPDQIYYLVAQGCIKPLCDLLGCPDNETIQIALHGLENILKVGKADKQAAGDTPDASNRYALFISECGGIKKIQKCQINANEEICIKAYNIIEKYFSNEDKKRGRWYGTDTRPQWHLRLLRWCQRWLRRRAF
ncbi:armadillo-type protein [Diaporthe sp. PMI_573]|nr:armadillo-type protein [Diaporthaceae sp. PMI_573]